MTERLPAWVDGIPVDSLPLDDRGLAYGDGLFETVLLHRGRPVWWQAHLNRLQRGAAALGIPSPPKQAWDTDLAGMLLGMRAPLPARLVFKLILTRGSSDRGYAADRSAPARRIVQLLPAPADRPDWRRDGIRLRWCTLTLSEQPRLAGFKHLNRLEQVLARAEWDDPAIGEGLLCRSDGAVVSATAANLVVAREGVLLTPPLERCGVAGICRGFLLSQSRICERELSKEEVGAGDELFLCNSLRGILPVTRLGDRSWPVGPLTRALMSHLAAAEPAFAFESDS
jgi:4-amino-4-deoxychorismate lyase